MVAQTGRGTFICWYCNEGLQDKRQLEIHIKIEHGQLVYGQSEWYGCKLCYNALYCRRQDIIKHMRNAHQYDIIQAQDYLIQSTQEIDLPCEMCGELNLFSKYCKEHGIVCEESDTYKKKTHSCIYCEESFSDSKFLDAHVNIEHGKRVHGDDEFECYQCNQCGVELYLGREAFLNHMRHIHSDDTTHDMLDNYVVKHVADITTPCILCKDPSLFSMFCVKHDARISIHHCDSHNDRHHKCTLCDAVFTNCENVWKHKFLVHSDENLACNLCEEEDPITIKSPSALMKHWRQWHWRLQEHEEHLNKSTIIVDGVVKFQCPHCNINHDDLVSLKQHIVEAHVPSISCSHCEMKFKNLKDFKEHMTSVHLNKRNLRDDTMYCELTEEEITLNIDDMHAPNRTVESDREKYKLVEGDQVRYKCSDCDKTYTRFYELKCHLMVHRGERTMSCTMCDKSFYQVSRLTEHYKRSHRMKVTRVNQLKKKSEICIEGETKYKCPLCPSITSRYDSLQQHMRLHTGEKPFSCQVCGKSFAAREHLKRHFNNIHMKVGYQCNVCGRVLTDSSNLKVHMRNHTGEKKYVCEICGKGFTQWASHYYHKFTHSEERSFKCSYCAMTFRCPRTLTEHKKTHVLSDVKHVCNTCGNEYNTRKNLLSHMKIHSTGRPHQCDVCNAKFKLRKYLVQHLKTHKGLPKLDPIENL
ncbi:zinc finger protein 665 [Diaphorina citri]|uniref:Zinc finger protein 665 n=1 Tax=Diaphorina citri TaxID=121845 RepID=A0A3Q0ISH6_DIACI|nr:zinc finger protein 665 [Diaphorina citri]KAI5707277.1 hypothetical protein M8J75_016294 [Diaphorina citri]KAI5740313.1 hypothetical protein M8J76_002634 [Diaphorina citri]KAI5747565.1 hypothetical protein M8J77_016059 [Diaphorina citri]